MIGEFIMKRKKKRRDGRMSYRKKEAAISLFVFELR